MSKKSPQLRFEGFTDDWEERKLGEIFNYEQPTKYIVKSTEYDDNFNTPVLTAGKSFLLGYTDEISGIKNATVENPVVIFDDFTTGSHYVDFPFKIKSSAMKLLSLNDNSDNFYFMFNTLKNIKYVPQSHERHWISKFSSFEIYKPSQEEQQKIGAFFKKIDDTIALHQRKLDLLKEQKKGFLQKMFPKNGAKVPELRFAGFADDWEERKLSDGTNKIGDGLHGTPKYSEDGEVYFVNGNNLVNGQIVIMPETKRVTSNEQSKDDKALNESTILMSINGTIGNLAWYRGENLMLGKSAAYIEVSDFDKKFIYAYLQTRPVKDYYLNSLTGTTIKNLGLKAIRNTNICTPTIDEQAKIGSFFKKLDDTIALHQRKLDLLKEQKKGFLQKMFV
ncbi:restriction endonuclease subunit S [Enterococcus casseliflavus]|uniref:restriction endonuclease subunit S n=1 Tax=Enterococcus casseliflavus TaxID=37734 RepID=UPI003D6BB021